MAKRVCAVHGKETDISGGKICERGHFICRRCANPTGHLGIFTFPKSKCPICDSKLR